MKRQLLLNKPRTIANDTKRDHHSIVVIFFVYKS